MNIQKNQKASVGECLLFARTSKTLEMGYIKSYKASVNKNLKIEDIISDLNAIKWESNFRKIKIIGILLYTHESKKKN